MKIGKNEKNTQVSVVIGDVTGRYSISIEEESSELFFGMGRY